MAILDLIILLIAIRLFLKTPKKKRNICGNPFVIFCVIALALLNILVVAGVVQVATREGTLLQNVNPKILAGIGLVFDVVSCLLLFRAPGKEVETELLTFQKIKVDKKTQQEITLQKQRDTLDEFNEKGCSERFGYMKFLYQDGKMKSAEKTAEKSMKILTDAVRNSAQQTKESNWAIAGGIASGLAGTGAGIMAAADTMANNQKIIVNILS